MSRFPNPLLAQQWRQRLERFEHSDLTIAEFCELEGYSPASFYQWRRRLAVIERADAPTFVPIDLAGHDSERCVPSPIEVQLPGGALIQLPSGTCPADYRSLIAAVVDATANADATDSGAGS